MLPFPFRLVSSLLFSSIRVDMAVDRDQAQRLKQVTELNRIKLNDMNQINLYDIKWDEIE
jgi:hypothetical protein